MNYTRYSREMHLFVRGELRTDGWISDWKKGELIRRAEEALKPRLILNATQILVRQEKRVREKKKYPRQHPNSYYFKRQCSVCASPIRKSNKTGRCIKHKLRIELERDCARCPFNDCGRQLNKQNGYGLCKEHYTMFRRLIHRNANRCFCGKQIRKDSRWDKCRSHSKKERAAYEYGLRKAA